MMEITSGATVSLKTSSPQMRVIGVRDDGWIVCQWRVDGKDKVNAFPLTIRRSFIHPT